MLVIAGVDKLRRNSHAHALFADRPFQDVIDVQLGRDFGNRGIGFGERKGRCPLGNLQAVDTSENIQDFFRDSFGEVSIIRVRAHIFERKYRNRRRQFGNRDFRIINLINDDADQCRNIQSLAA